MQTAIVTGGAKGIGRGIVEQLLKNNDNMVIANYNTSKKSAYELKNQFKNIDIYKADITNKQEVHNMVNYIIDKYGIIDVLINNAGISQIKLFQDITYEEWDKMIISNLSSAFYTCKEIVPYMINKQSGCIINISSIWGIVGGACEVHYSASKSRNHRNV